MIGQKLTKILQSLDPDEFKRLKRALSSPYFATNARLLVLYEYLKKYYPDFKEEKFQKEKLFKKLYPDKPFNDGVLRVLVREFTTVVEDYILLERLRADKHQRKKLLVKEYGQRNLYEYFKKGTEEIIDSQDGDFLKDMEYFSERIGLYQEYCFHPMTNNFQMDDDSLEKLMDSLDAYFILAKYRFAQILKNRDTIFNRISEIKFLDSLIEDKYGFSSTYALTGIYNLLNKLHDTGEETFFFELKKMFFENIDKIKRTDCLIVYFIGLNYCSRQIGNGVKKYSKECLEWYKSGLNKNLLIENGKMSDITFTNICSTACREKDTEWAVGFLDEYQKFLDDTIAPDAINYAKSILYFSQGKFEDSLQILRTYYFSNRYQLSARSLTILNIFEQSLIDFNYYSILFSHIEADKKYLLRNKMFNDSKKMPHKNLLKVVEKFAKKMVDKNDNKKIKKWLGDIVDNEKVLPLRTWFLEKYEQL